MAPPKKFKVIVVGAGLGGCAAALAMKHHGHDVVVYEKIRHFRRLGDSLGLGENALKLLRRWGGEPLYERLINIGNQAENMQIRRWHDGKILAVQPLMDMAGRIGHRGDYHEAFLQGVRDAGIPLHMGREIVAYDEQDDPAHAPKEEAAATTATNGDTTAAAAAASTSSYPVRVTFADGATDGADLVVGADGIKSRARELVLGFDDAPRSSGYACFRAYFAGAHLQQNPLCRDFADHDCVNIWIGVDTHLVQNTLRGGAEFNWIVTRKIASPEREAAMLARESWFQEGDMAEVQRCVAGLDARIAAAVAATDRCLDWIICYRDPLPTWVARGHHIALLGDSCHAHLPTSAQGASQATESAGVLAQCLSLAAAAAAAADDDATRADPVALATRTYEKLRFDRVRQSQTNGEDLRDRWHNALRNMDDGVEIDPESIKIRNRWLYAYDAEADTRERWAEVSAQVDEELRTGTITPLCEVGAE